MDAPRGLAFIIDNFDSFTWNVAHALVAAGMDVAVRRADTLRLEEIADARASLLVISPGPGRPEDARASLRALDRFGGRVPILGVCLGMQCIAIAFGGTVAPTGAPVHGKASPVDHDGSGLFASLPSPLRCARYHSLAVEREPSGLAVNARLSGALTPMALRHPSLPIAGVQFHPDSFLTEGAERMFDNAARGIL
jgi:anthranilate synthase/aminodeoxychorismate synthase-like glutamine amidotransferase